MVGGELVGPPDVTVSAVAPIDRARSSDLSFLASAKYASLLTQSAPGVLLVTRELAGVPGGAQARVIVDKPHDALLGLLPRLYRAPTRTAGVHTTVRLGRGARLGDGASLGAYVIVGDGARIGPRTTIDAHTVIGEGVEIGADCHIYPHVTVYPGSSLGSRVVVQAGARLGSEGFGYVFRDGAHTQIPHIGRCIVHDDVDIGANTTIDRGSIDDTVIGAGTKIDNLVQIAHNVHVGRLCLIMAQVGIAGSTRLGDGCILGGQAGINGHIELGDGVRIAAQAGVFGNVPPGETWSGYPARPHREAIRASAALYRLANMMKRLERLLSERE
jgi:UDP-3-O-[3-hydroxymyristoyl] glucosamine N-acyltransferase